MAPPSCALIVYTAAVFETLWNSEDFRVFDRAEFLERGVEAHPGLSGFRVSPVEIRLEPFQERLLEQIELARSQGRHRNLLVAATGTGKTVMAAVDYLRLSLQRQRTRLLFVAHRQKILEQALATYRHARREPGFGELWVGGERPSRFDHVFASVQSLNAASLDHLDPTHFDVVVTGDFPLRVHARYSRIEILAAIGEITGAHAPPWREGVYWAKNVQTDVFAFTLDKSKGHFSPTTRYKDYAISRELIHWESQSTTSVDSKTGRRYRDHKTLGSRVLLFARNNNDERAFWFLGPATYVSHEGSRPMAVTWSLAVPLPADLYLEFRAAVA